MSYSDIRVNEARTEVEYRLRLRAIDTAEALGLDPSTEPPDEALTAGADRLFDYVRERIEVLLDGHSCPTERLGSRLIHQTERFVELGWRMRCAEPFRSLVVDYNLFFDLDPLHTGNLRVTVPGEPPAIVPLREGRSRFVWDDLSEAPPSSLAAFVRHGIAHILYGYDHVAFLLGLFLVVAISRGSSREWRPRPVGSAVKYTAGIVSSFTVAHSITLIAAALGAISLPSRVVESLIAASILYIAVENIVRPDVRHRWVLTFLFGLVHGLGFAAVLRNLLPPEQVIVPLLAFNLGVEIGQISLVLVIIPLLCLLASRVIGARRYRVVVVDVGSAAIGLLGATWLVERVFGLPILGF